MKQVLAYFLLMTGAPIALGCILSLLGTMIVTSLFGRSVRTEIVCEACSGFVTLIIAMEMFRFLGARPNFAVPLILAFLNSIWLYGRNEYRAMRWQLAGILGGYVFLLMF